MPQVSIIVPVYKAENVLSRCIDSILAQSFLDFELILVDDGSPDNSGLICDSYAAKDSRITVVHQRNSGVSAARNTGISHAKCPYILFVDSDDYLDLDYVSQLVSHPSDLTICGIETRDDHDHFLYNTPYTPVVCTTREEIDFPRLYEEILLYSPYCKLFRLDLIQQNQIRFHPTITWGEDGMFVADYLQYIHSLNVLKYTGYYYIKYGTDASLSTKLRENIVEMVVTSREYCIEQMRNTSPHHYEAVKDICTDDLRWNCVYFVNKFLLNTTIKKREKIRVLNIFCSFPHVVFTLQHPETYYPAHATLYTMLKTANPRKIVAFQYKQIRRNRIKRALYAYYDQLPHWVKKVYRTVKRGIRL